MAHFRFSGIVLAPVLQVLYGIEKLHRAHFVHLRHADAVILSHRLHIQEPTELFDKWVIASVIRFGLTPFAFASFSK